MKYLAAVPILLFALTALNSAELSEIEEEWNYSRMLEYLELYMEDQSIDDMEKLKSLYSMMERADSWKIGSSIETYYHQNRGERPSGPSLDRNLKLSLFIEQLYIRIDGIKTRTANELEDIISAVSGTSGEIGKTVEDLQQLNEDMSAAVRVVRESYKDISDLKDDYLAIIDLQGDIMASALELKGPEAILITGAGLTSTREGDTSLSLEAGILYNFGLFEFGIRAHSSLDANLFGASLLFGWNIR